MAKVAVLGAGYVGLTTGACLAHIGHDVVCTDVDEAKVSLLQSGRIPIVEDGLEEMVREGLESERLQFSLSNTAAAADAEFVFLCVPTPQGDDGSADMSFIQTVASEVGPVLAAESIVINKSTVPVGSTHVVEQALGRSDVFVVSNPEFLREGSAVHDFLHPDRIVVGSDHQSAAIRVSELFEAIKAPFVVTDPPTAETIKYASNAFLATKVSFINAVANLCEAVGANVREVVLGMGYDKRIGFEFLVPGPGWGGSCFSGAETVLVAHGDGSPRLLSFTELAAEVERLGPNDWAALSWSADEPAPHMAPVSAFTVRPYSGDFVQFQTKMGRRLAVTADHPLVVGNGSDRSPTAVIPAGELTTDHWVPIALGTPFHDRDVPREIDVLGCLDEAGIRIPADNDFWRMVGLYLSEGSITADAGSHGSTRQRTTWYFHPTDEEDLVSFVAGYWEGLGVKVSVAQATTTRVVKVSSRIVAGLFAHGLKLGRNCYEHRLPDVIWGASEDSKRSVLRGLWDGDGSWSRLNQGANVVLEYGTVSRALADGMVRLLGELGVVARIKVGMTAKSTVPTYWLAISGADQVEECLWLFGDEEAEEIREVLAGASKRIAPTGYRRLSKNTAWVRVSKTVRHRYDGPVYSLEVPGSRTVVTTGGLVAHNCFPKDTRALVRIAEDAGYDFGLLKGVIAVNSEQHERIVAKVLNAVGGSVEGVRIAVWGLTFKARTDDLRDSPALAVVGRLSDMGAKIRAYDPTVARPLPGMDTVTDAYEACEDAAALVVLTEWDEFRWLDLGQVRTRMASARIVDARNLLDPSAARRAGFRYDGIGQA